jgi:hypothetical protein
MRTVPSIDRHPAGTAAHRDHAHVRRNTVDSVPNVTDEAGMLFRFSLCSHYEKENNKECIERYRKGILFQ